MLKAFSRASAPFVFATAALSIFAVHCGGDDGTPTGTAGSTAGGTGGTTAGGSSSGGGGATAGGTGGSGGSATGGGGATAGGTGGSATGGGGAGGTAGGTGGAGGAGGGTGGAGGAGGTGGAGGSGGAPGATFAQVKTVLMACAGNQCHSEPSQHIDWITDAGLYTRMTSPIGNNGAHCKDKTPVVPNMPDQSLLVQIVKGSVQCEEEIAKMPFMCGQGQRQCLTDAQIKVITDWISAGAPQ